MINSLLSLFFFLTTTLIAVLLLDFALPSKLIKTTLESQQKNKSYEIRTENGACFCVKEELLSLDEEATPLGPGASLQLECSLLLGKVRKIRNIPEAVVKQGLLFYYLLFGFMLTSALAIFYFLKGIKPNKQ